MSSEGDNPQMPEKALVPARVVNEHVYCPRLAWLEWEARAFTDNAETAEGSDAHRRADVERGDIASEDEAEVATAVLLSSEELGLIAKLDKIERKGGVTVPVETKRGTPRRGDSPVWEPELAQLAAQVLLLREAGHTAPHAEVFFTKTRTRHRVQIPTDAEPWIRGLVAEIRENAARPHPPPPLVDSPKCPRCSLVSICLPDETNFLAQRANARPRRLVAVDSPAMPLYVTTPGAFLRKRGGRLILEEDGKEASSRRMIDVSHLAVYGNVTISSAAMRACLERDIPVLWFSAGGWFTGYSVPHGGSWVARRQAQYASAKSARVGSLSARFIAGKIRNQRTLIRRLAPGSDPHALVQLKLLAEKVDACDSVPSLLGYEGVAARLYFAALPSMLGEFGARFEFEGRNRRPPKDQVNAMLSFAYALLLRDTTVAALAAGLDPQVGLLHQPRFGRPSLALDLAEEFRPLVADSAVIMAVKNGEIRDRHFLHRGGAVTLTRDGRAAMIGAYERRVAVRITHPLFGYKTSYRRTIELQGRQLAAVIEGELEDYHAIITR